MVNKIECSFVLMSNDVKRKVLEFLDPQSLGNQSAVEKFSQSLINQPATWGKLAKTLKISLNPKQDPKEAVLERFAKINSCVLSIFPEPYKRILSEFKEGPFGKVKNIERTLIGLQEDYLKHEREISFIHQRFIQLLEKVVQAKEPNPIEEEALITLIKKGVFYATTAEEWYPLLCAAGAVEENDFSEGKEIQPGNLRIYRAMIEQIMLNEHYTIEQKFEILEHQVCSGVLRRHNAYEFYEVLYEAGLEPTVDHFNHMVKWCPPRLWGEARSPIGVLLKYASEKVIKECQGVLEELKAEIKTRIEEKFFTYNPQQPYNFTAQDPIRDNLIWRHIYKVAQWSKLEDLINKAPQAKPSKQIISPALKFEMLARLEAGRKEASHQHLNAYFDRISKMIINEKIYDQ